MVGATKVQVSDDEADALYDHAEEVARTAWAALCGHDAQAAIVVIGTLLASIEAGLIPQGYTREQLIEEVCEIADGCEPIRGNA